MVKKANENIPRTREEINNMMEEAAKHYGKFLNALGFDYMADRQTIDTPKRVAKSWMKDLVVGSVTEGPGMTIFPNEERYEGVVIQTGIRVNSICAHHNLPFMGWASVAYIPGDYLKDNLKRESIAVSLSSKHTCCGIRGVKHPESVMTTNSFSGMFMEKNNLVREEFLQAINKNGNKF